MFEILSDYETNIVAISPQTTLAELDELYDVLGTSDILMLINQLTQGTLERSLKEGWKPGNQKLGEFVRAKIEKKRTIDEFGEMVLDLFDDYGEVFAEGNLPIVVILNKNTGKVIDLDEEDMKRVIDRINSTDKPEQKQ